MSFCRSLLGLLTMISRTSWPLLGMSTTKKTRSSRSLVTALMVKKRQRQRDDACLPGFRRETLLLVPLLWSIPPLILCDGAFFQLPSNGGEHFTGIVGKVKVSHFSRGDGHNSKSLLVLFQCRGADLESEESCTNLSQSNELNDEKFNYTSTVNHIQKNLQQGGGRLHRDRYGFIRDT